MVGLLAFIPWALYAFWSIAAWIIAWF